MRPMTIDQIDFGVVERAITVGNEKKLRGCELTHSVLAAMPAANRNALIENRFITVYPKGVSVRRENGAVPLPVSAEGELHVIAKGFGKWDVIQGTVVGTGLTKEAAQAMAGKAQPLAPVNQTAPPLATAGPRKPKKRRASLGKRLPAKPPGEPQDNGPIE